MRILTLVLAITAGSVSPLRAQGELECPPPDSLSGMATVRGRVVEAESQMPLRSVQLRLSKLDGPEVQEARSGPGGSFSFCSVPEGWIELTGQMGQLGGRIGPVSLSPGQTLSLTLEVTQATEGANTGTLTGAVIDAGSREPVEGAAVLIPDLGQTVITNSFGRFTFPSLPPGETSLRVTRIGYAPSTGTVEVLYARTTHTEVVLSTEPIALDPIEVTAVRRRIVLPGLEDIERRIHNGWGKFVLEEEIQRRRPSKLSYVLVEAGVVTGQNGHSLSIRRTGCGPTVYIDDVRVTHLPRTRGVFGKMSSTGGAVPLGAKTPQPGQGNPEEEAADAVNNMVHPMDVIAVEVYRGPAETPGQYIDSNAQCGVILIWTRRGNIGRR